MAITESKVHGAMVEDLEIVSHVITRYSILEATHLQRKTMANDELQRRLTDLYAEILTLLAKSKKNFEMPSAGERFSFAP